MHERAHRRDGLRLCAGPRFGPQGRGGGSQPGRPSPDRAGTWDAAGEAVRSSFEQAGAPFTPTVEVRYCNTACVLAAAGVGVAVVDPFSPRQGGSHELAVRPFTPSTPAIAHMLWSEAQPLSYAGEWVTP